MILTPSFRTALTGSSAALLIAVLPAQGGSQGGTQTTFGVSEKTSALNDATGTSLSATTGLSFSTSSATPLDSLSLSGGLGLVLTRNPDGSTSSQMTTPNLSFGYDRKSASAEAKVNLGYARDQIQTVRPLSDFINSDGQLVLPTNPNDLLGTGLKQTETAGASLELGRNGPFGLTLTGGYDKTVYSQTTAPDLLDTSSASLGLKGRFSYSPVGDLTLGLATSHNTTQGASTQDITTLDLGTSYKISPVLSVSGGANYTITNDSAAGRSTSVSPTVGANYTLKDGSIAFSAAKSQASLSWQQKTADGSVSAQLSHGPGGSNGTGTQNAIGVNYNRSLDAVSSLGLGLYYSDLTSPGANVSGTSLSASYNHAITKDWGLNAGMSYQRSNQTGSGTTNTTGLFLTLSRNFSFRH